MRISNLQYHITLKFLRSISSTFTCMETTEFLSEKIRATIFVGAVT